jgi:hypothetical protein
MPQGSKPARRMPFKDFLLRYATVLCRTTNRWERGLNLGALHERHPNQSSEFAKATRRGDGKGPGSQIKVLAGVGQAAYYFMPVYN